jgi:hypothetical protein
MMNGENVNKLQTVWFQMYSFVKIKEFCRDCLKQNEYIVHHSTDRGTVKLERIADILRLSLY